MNKINFENGTLIEPAKVIINGVTYNVVPEEWSTNTPLSAEILNQLQSNVESAINDVANNNGRINNNMFSLASGVELMENQSFFIGNMVFINLKLSSSITTDYKTYLTIDNSLKPSTETVLQATSSRVVASNGWIRSNGQIAIKFAESGNSEDIRILSFYPLV